MAETTETLTVSRSEAQKYEVYEKWYANKEGLFSALGKFLMKQGAGYLSRIDAGGVSVSPKSSVENLRNPVHRVVEFHATTILTGLLEEMLKVEADEDEEGEATEGEEKKGRAETFKEAVLQIWEWSNLAQQIRVAKRHLARDGQFFWKIARPEGKDSCYIQVIPAKHATEYDADEIGNVTYARIDVPGSKTEDGQSRKIWTTEIWRKGKIKDGEKQPGYALFAEVERTSDDSVPSEKRVAEAAGAQRIELGSDSDGYKFDFVPFVVVNAQDTGEKRPEPVYAHGLHLVSWICREATRLSDLMFRFNKAFKVIFGMGNDAQNRPMPPPKPGHVRDLGSVHQESQAEHTVPMGGARATLLSRENEDISIEGVAVTGLPGTAQMADATPNINYEAARVWINDHVREVYEELPELLYYAIESRANQSGAALRTLIAGAISRGEEMQSNLVAGLVKADKMALTIAQLASFDGFSEGQIGTYENGGFDHEIEPPEIMPLTEEEKQQVEASKLTNAQSLVALLSQLGVSRDEQRRIVLTELGHEDLIESADDSQAPEGTPSADELAASQQALAARLNGGIGGGAP